MFHTHESVQEQRRCYACVPVVRVKLSTGEFVNMRGPLGRRLIDADSATWAARMAAKIEQRRAARA